MVFAYGIGGVFRSAGPRGSWLVGRTRRSLSSVAIPEQHATEAAGLITEEFGIVTPHHPLRVVRRERRTSLTANAGCWHARPMGHPRYAHASARMLTLMPSRRGPDLSAKCQ